MLGLLLETFKMRTDTLIWQQPLLSAIAVRDSAMDLNYWTCNPGQISKILCALVCLSTFFHLGSKMSNLWYSYLAIPQLVPGMYISCIA